MARLGADEFGIILGHAGAGPSDADAFARRLLQLVAAPVIVGDQRIRLTANVGYLDHRARRTAAKTTCCATSTSRSRRPSPAVRTASRPGIRR